MKPHDADDFAESSAWLLRDWRRLKRRIVKKRMGRWLKASRYISRFKRDRHDGAVIRMHEREFIQAVLKKARTEAM